MLKVCRTEKVLLKIFNRLTIHAYDMIPYIPEYLKWALQNPVATN